MNPAHSRKAPAHVAGDDLTFQDPLQVTFSGWNAEAFNILVRLEAEPHIAQYREERDQGLLDEYIKQPFRKYRDDLVVNWVLPSNLKFETEAYVFSRLLKNDFGAGGCHHHKWMAFYRPDRKRLTDVQITHSLHPEGFDIGVFIGKRAEDVFRQARQNIIEDRRGYLDLLNDRLVNDSWHFYYRVSTRKSDLFTLPLSQLPADIAKANGLWLRRRCTKSEILNMRGQDQLRFALESIYQLWPLYRFYLIGRAST